ncbi:response regulator [Vibrio coralliilyticus OCN008]|jgi:CheY-like chemotaxis protein|uniref:response regulator n=1 Tax=Vibrio coralliilyticus TaxID=190893 RepID=UPI000391317C|nr:response regulator [Vibrio coralliilyticus]ERB63672.1 histidine kinase [Vibrio coralliilyticus OCN008]QIJ86003.1 response regulator [Vibrio coralliilyticus OCN008]
MSNYDPTNFTILVVEDHKFSRQALVGMLVRGGYENLLCAKDGMEAMTKCAENKIDLIITDINMPNINGLELIKAIRTNEAQIACDTRIIAVTTLSDTATISACMTLEVDAFLVKPINIKSAKEKIQSAITEPKCLYQQHFYNDVSTSINLAPQPNEPDTTKRIRSIDSRVHELSQLSELKEGMTLVYDINAVSGGCLLRAGTILNKKLILRLFELSKIVDTNSIVVREDKTQMAV